MKFQRAFLLSLVFAGLMACGPSRKNISGTNSVYFSENGERLVIRQFNVVFPASLGARLQGDSSNEANKLKLIAAIRAHVESFESNEGIYSLPCNIAVTDSSDLSNLDIKKSSNQIMDADGEKIIGFYRYPNAIVVWVGENYTVPALYHELCHLNFQPFDFDHNDSRWAQWKQRGSEVVNKLNGQ